MSQKLSLLDSSSDSEVELKVNKNYAHAYDQWRNKEELQKYKDLKKDEEDSESSSESEEEIPEFDEEFFRALSLLKSKDPRIYDKDFELFKKKEILKKPKKNVKEKPIYMKDYERNLVLEKGGQFSDEDEEDNIPEEVPTYDEEQENLKKSFKEAVGGLDDSDGDADDLLQVRTKTKEEEEAEETDYVKWLKGEEKEVSEDVKRDMSYLRNYWNDPKLDEGEKFLRDYILNKRYLEKDDSEIPTYEEVTSGLLSDDEKMIDELETFEHKYNFRFEEPDEEFIKRYPRTIGDSLRRTDNRRKQKREEKAERIRKDREQRREELKRLKALKRKEIEEKFMKLKEISGQDEINLNESDIESDFDPDKHDRKMNEMFNDDYYQVEEDKKPEFPFDEELDSENWNAWAGERIVDEDDDENSSGKEESTESNQDKSNFKEEFANEMISASRPKKRVKKKSLFAKIISQPKPLYDPDGKSFEEYLDDYYKLDYEDIVADIPVRYKYRKVIPNDFGLSVDEILTADDRELNRWCSVKKTCQYRKEEEELYDVQAFRKRAQVPQIKKKFLPSVYAPKETESSDINSNNEINNSENELENDTKPVKNDSNAQADNEENSSLQVQQKKKSKKKKRNQNHIASGIEGESSSAHFTENDTKPVKNDSNAQVDNEENFNLQVQQKKKSKKRKRKQNHDASGTEGESSSVHFTESNNASNIACESSYVPNTERKLDVNDYPSTSFEENSSRKSVKRKKKVSADDSLVDPDSGEVRVDFSLKSKQENTSHSNVSSNVSSGIGSDNVSEEPAKKKRKKKKKKKNKHRENGPSANVSELADESKSKPRQNKLKGRYKEYASGDKRLALSDERLAAYGINPKKFKNKIIYSKK